MADTFPALDRATTGLVYDSSGVEIGPGELLVTAERIDLSLVYLNDSGTRAESFGGLVPENREPLPSDLLFVNVDYRLALSGCWFAGNPRNLGSRNHAAVLVRARAAVATGALCFSYGEIEGIRSEIAGLPGFLQRSSLSVDHELDDESRIEALTITARAQPPVVTTSPLGLSLRPHFTTATEDDGRDFTIHDKSYVETRLDGLGAWDDHLREHRSIQELIALAYWWPCRMIVVQAFRSDDPDTALSGDVMGEAWRAASAPDAGRPAVHGRDKLPRSRRPLFVYDDIGPTGLQRWMDSYETRGRLYWILAASLYQQHRVVEPQLLQVGTALEVLGLHLIQGGPDASSVGSSYSYLTVLEAIGNATTCSLAPVTGPDRTFEEWTRSFNLAYKGVKHADNPLPDPNEAHQLTQQAVTLVRLWLALELGVAAADLDRRHYML